LAYLILKSQHQKDCYSAILLIKLSALSPLPLGRQVSLSKMKV